MLRFIAEILIPALGDVREARNVRLRVWLELRRVESRQREFHVPVEGLGRRVVKDVNESWNEVAGERDDEPVGDDGELADAVEDSVPDSDVPDASEDRPTVVSEEFLRVESHLADVVDEREERREWKSRNEDRHEAVLEYHLEVLGEQSSRAELHQLQVADVTLAFGF